MYQCLSVYVPLCTYMRVNACACAHLTMFLIPARSHMPHCLCDETSRMAAFRATDWTKCRHAQRMAALSCSSVALGVAQTLCSIALREIACTKCCHLQHFAALRRPSATCNSISCSRLHEMLLYAALGRSASPRRYTLRATTCCAIEPFAHAHLRTNTRTHSRPLHLLTAGPRCAIMKRSFRIQRLP